MEGKSSTQNVEIQHFLRCLPIDPTVQIGYFLTVQIFCLQIIANLPSNATEIISFPKTFKVCFWKNRWVFSRKNLNFFKMANSGKFAVECVSNDILIKMCFFHLKWGIFAEFRELQNLMVKEFEKNTFILLKGFFDKLGGRNICQCPAVLFAIWKLAECFLKETITFL